MATIKHLRKVSEAAYDDLYIQYHVEILSGNCIGNSRRTINYSLHSKDDREALTPELRIFLGKLLV
jgi:hypothetical protein